MAKNKSLNSQKKTLNFDIEHIVQKFGIPRFQVIRTLKKHWDALVEKFESMKKEIKYLENSP